MEEQKNNLKNEIEEMTELVEKNIKLSEEILALSKKINGFVIWQRIFGIIKILIIAIPIALSIIYLPPLLNGVLDTYKELLGLGDAVNGDLPNLDNLPNSVKEYLK
ncbi:hypothetical protein KAU09_04970 [Candidatus Parcubacteria bacterium]|nr:hypothetical protein [Candidatus Parcubacteria bacterium]